MKLRAALFVAVVVLVTLGTGGYILIQRQRQADAKASAPTVVTRSDLDALSTQARIVFRSTALGESYGRVAVVPLTAPDGPRAFAPAQCDRVYAISGRATCLSAERGIVTTYRAQVLGPDWQPQRDLPLTGVPSRTRLSRDGSLAATTTFISGHDYASPGSFSTETVVSRVDGPVIGNIEEFALTVDGVPVTAADRNMWGVTFVDNDRFFATAASGKKTWLVRGSLSARTLTSLREDAECPSLSPDGERIAFKRRGDLPAGRWRLAVYDLGSGRETMLAEERSVDDQVEWLDAERVVYGLPRAEAGTATSDVWWVPADGTGRPELLIHDAWSPAVIR